MGKRPQHMSLLRFGGLTPVPRGGTNLVRRSRQTRVTKSDVTHRVGMKTVLLTSSPGELC